MVPTARRALHNVARRWASGCRSTHFLDSPRMGQVLGRSDFAFADMKASPASLFLVLPPIASPPMPAGCA